MSNLLEFVKENNFKDYNYLIDYEELNKIINSIDKNILYKSNCHGLYHSEKVTFFSYIIAKYLKLSNEDLRIILDASMYHDIGRVNDEEDKYHGYLGTLKLDFLGNKDIYKRDNNLKILKAIIVGHSNDDNKKDKIFSYYEIDNDEYTRYNILYDILKDADALDRLRFSSSLSYTLDINFLRLEISKNIVDIARLVNEYYLIKN